MSMGMITYEAVCDYEQPTKDGKGLWECVQDACDGVHHYLQISPWRWSTKEQSLW
jgi:hypothetical protein